MRFALGCAQELRDNLQPPIKTIHMVQMIGGACSQSIVAYFFLDVYALNVVKCCILKKRVF